MIQTFSNWYLEDERSLDEIREILEKKKKEPSKTIGQGFWNLENKNIDIEEECVEFLTGTVFSYVPKRNYQNLPKDLQMNEVEANFIIYKDEERFKLILLTSKTNSKYLVNKVFTDLSILENNQIDKDFLYWIMYRLREVTDKPLIENEMLYLRGLVKYMGTSSDKVNVVSGKGLRVLTLMGTLSFIFNDEDLKSLRPRIQYKTTEITVELNSSNTNRVEIDDADSEEQFKKYILVSKIILPKLLEAYNIAKSKGSWSAQIKLVFLQGIGSIINEKVQEQLAKIQKDIDTLDELNVDDERYLEDYQMEFDTTEFDGEFEQDCNEI